MVTYLRWVNKRLVFKRTFTYCRERYYREDKVNNIFFLLTTNWNSSSLTSPRSFPTNGGVFGCFYLPVCLSPPSHYQHTLSPSLYSYFALTHVHICSYTFRTVAKEKYLECVRASQTRLQLRYGKVTCCFCVTAKDNTPSDKNETLLYPHTRYVFHTWRLTRKPSTEVNLRNFRIQCLMKCKF